MDRLFANGTVNAAQSGEGPPLFLFHSLLSDRASFDAIVPGLVAIVSRDRSGIAGLRPLAGRRAAVLPHVADRMAEAVKDAAGGEDAIVLGNGYGGFVALQMAIRHPGIAAQARSRRLRRGVFGAGPRSLPQHGGGVARPRGWRRSPMSRCAGCSRRNSRRSIRT